MLKPILISSLVLLAVSVTAVATGITSVQQMLFWVLVIAFFAVLVKGAIEGVNSRAARPHGPSRSAG